MTFRMHDAELVRIIDGDTVELDVDLGFHVRYRGSFRIYGINARERTDPGGAEAARYLASLLPHELVISSVKPDKFGGRYDAILCLPDGRDVADVMIANHWAAAWDGTGTKPVPPWPRP